MHPYLFFFVAFSLLLTHEMDAVRRYEWQIFPGLARISDDSFGYTLFTALHVPLYVLILLGLIGGDGAISRAMVIGLDLFCMLHVVLHILFRTHPRYQFHGWFSRMLIWGAGVAGGVDLLLRW